ncbi:MAG: hypothetical protein RR558_11820, partial [Coprobacillus sp.]
SGVLYETAPIKNTLGEIISKNNLSQLRIAETEKYAHVTFFMDGGLEVNFNKEKRILIPSPKVNTYDESPNMSAIDITDILLKNIREFDFIILNFANADMVGHTGNFDATLKSIKCLDEQVKRIYESLNDEYKEKYETYGRRNIANLTIAPAGSVSLMTQTTSGIEPLFK